LNLPKRFAKGGLGLFDPAQIYLSVDQARGQPSQREIVEDLAPRHKFGGSIQEGRCRLRVRIACGNNPAPFSDAEVLCPTSGVLAEGGIKVPRAERQSL
jgi:hypothetical protein